MQNGRKLKVKDFSKCDKLAQQDKVLYKWFTEMCS